MAEKPVKPSRFNEGRPDIRSIIPGLIELRQKLHQHAELSGSEERTAEIITKYLRTQTNARVVTGIGGHGILAEFESLQPGPTIGFRAELDALPIAEVNDCAYRSLNPKVSHKCGHDGHMTILCGMASFLSQNPLVSGKVQLLFQPAEETGEGAARMLADPQFQSFNPDYIFALHNLPGFPLRQVIVKSGTLFCASEGMIIQLTGKTCHAAHPEEGINPAEGMCQIISLLNQLPADQELSEHFAMVTIVHTKLGEVAFGTSPGEAVIMCTLRTETDEAMSILKQKAVASVERISGDYRLKHSVSWSDSFSATQNDPDATEIIRESAHSAGFDISVLEKPFRPSEDFGLFLSRFKGAMFGLGAGVNHPALHHDDYDFPDNLIETGIFITLSILNTLRIRPQ